MNKLIFTVLFIGIQASIFAHPHIFIKTELTVCFDNEGISKFKVKYNFDKIFSADLKQNFDANKNNIFEASEIETIRTKAFSNLVNYNYFIHLKIGGEKIKNGKISNFKAVITKTGVYYTFNINTHIPIGKTKKVFKIATYDHSYFISVNYKKESIKFENTGNYIFTHKTIEDKTQAYYYKQIYPECVILSVKQK